MSDDFERDSEDRNPILEGLTGTSDEFVGSSTASKLDENRCKIATLQDKDLLLGNDRDDDRLRLTRYSLDHPEGVPLPQIVRDVFGKTGPANPGDSDYQLARRFYTDNSEFFNTFTQNGMTAVEPDLPLFDLISEGIVQKSGGASTDRGICRSLLASVSSLNSEGKELLSDEIGRYVNRINDYRLLFRLHNLRSGSSDLFMKPYKTRFNDFGRIKQQWARYHASLDFARDEFDTAALVTLTTDPKQFPHLLAMTDEITSNFNRLLSWMAYDCKEKKTSRPGYRPPYLRILEFTEDGKPHLHIIFFDVPERNGEPYLIGKDELSKKWDSLGQGRIVDIQGLTYRDDLDDAYDLDAGFVNLDEAKRLDAGKQLMVPDGGSAASGVGGGQTAGQYLGKYLSATFGGMMAAGADGCGGSDALTRDFDDSDKMDAYKIALYWVTGKRIWTVSKDIEQAIEPEEDDPEDLPIVIEFIGTYPYWDLPASVVSNSRKFAEYVEAEYGSDEPDGETGTKVDNPPPNSGGSAA